MSFTPPDPRDLPDFRVALERERRRRAPVHAGPFPAPAARLERPGADARRDADRTAQDFMSDEPREDLA